MTGAAPFIDVVYFAGAGGSSEAYRLALGRDPDIALNHNSTALSVHQVNFPNTEHYVADVFDVDPRELRPGVHWRSFWASPDCRHFSKAKGGAPVSPRIRGLAWIVVKVAKLVRPDVIFLENVEEFQHWGPLLPPDAEGLQKPDPERRGQTFKLWKKRLEQCGYVVEHRELIAADYGAPTTRKRLFLVGRCDGKPIVWPSPTHAPRAVAKAKGLKPYRAAAEIIDWSIPTPSIFGRPRPLQPKTCARIAKGIKRYVIDAPHPFIVPVTHSAGWNASRSTAEPLPTITTAKGGEFAVSAPHITKFRSGAVGSDMADPLPTVTANSFIKRAGCGTPLGLAAAHLTKFSENSIGTDPGDPLHTAMAGAPRHGLVSAYLGRQFGSTVSGRNLSDPHPAVMTDGAGGKSQVVTAHISSVAYGDDRPRAGLRASDMENPVGTLTGSNDKAVAAAFLDPYYGVSTAMAADAPLGTATAKARFGLGAAFMEQANTGATGHDARAPVSTILGKGCTNRLIEAVLAEASEGRRRDVLAFLWEHFGEPTEAEIAEPLATPQGRLRFGLVILDGVVWQIVDIGMRMLVPAELKGAQGFGAHYITDRNARGEAVTKTEQTRQIGNSVSPINGAALIAANLDPEPDMIAEAA